MPWFMFWMVFASSLGFIKLILLALILDASNYGHYISMFSLSTLISAIISFGLIEQTYKMYPRQWVEKKHSDILCHAKNALKILFVRFTILAIVGFIITSTMAPSFKWLDIIYVYLLGLSTAWLAIFASLYRATGIRKSLQGFSLWRSGFAFFLALIGGVLLGWVGAMSGDILASALTSLYAVANLRKLYNQTSSETYLSTSINSQSNKFGHKSLYIANTLTASTTMADRALVSFSLGVATAGSYGVIMLLPQVFQMLVNVSTQYIGPLIIKFTHLRYQDKSYISALCLQGFFLTFLVVICITIMLSSKHLPIIDELFMKYSISNISLILAGMIAAGQIYSLIEFHLIAYDGERFVLVASILSGSLFFVLFAIAIYHSLSVEYFIGVSAIARWLQVSILIWALLKMKKKT